MPKQPSGAKRKVSVLHTGSRSRKGRSHIFYDVQRRKKTIKSEQSGASLAPVPEFAVSLSCTPKDKIGAEPEPFDGHRNVTDEPRKEQLILTQWEELMDCFNNIGQQKLRRTQNFSGRSHQIQEDPAPKFYCYDCVAETTSCTSFWHVRVPVMEDTDFYPLKVNSGDLKQLNLRLPEQHTINCSGTHSDTKTVTVYDEKGRKRSCTLEVCSEIPIAAVFLWHSLWPSTLDSPTTGFHWSLMEMLYADVVETRRSLWKACRSATIRGQLHLVDSSTAADGLYKLLQNKKSFRVFIRVMQSQQQLRDLGPPFVREAFKPQCGPCPKKQDTLTGDKQDLIYCFDGNCQLTRKHKGEIDERIDEGTSTFWVNQSEMDSFGGQITDDAADKECSDFAAANTEIAKRKNKRVDVTGVIGCNCRHQHPQLYADLREGEKYYCAKYLMSQLLSKAPPNVQLHGFYDIACNFVQHLLRAQSDTDKQLLENFKFWIPVLHSYAHNQKCQLEYNPRVMGDVGLTDGEGVERHWSILEEAAKSTKEMTASNRQAMLDDILRCYSELLNGSLEKWIVKRYGVSVEAEKEARNKLHENLSLLRDKPSLLSQDFAIKCWKLDIEKSFSVKGIEKLSKQMEWKKDLCLLLERRHLTRQKMLTVGSDGKTPREITDLITQYEGIIETVDASIIKINRKHQEAEGLQYGEQWFWEILNSVHKEVIRPILVSLFKACVNRRFYAEVKQTHKNRGQIANGKMVTLIATQEEKIQQLILKYNEAAKPTEPRFPNSLDEKLLWNLESNLWDEIHSVVDMDKKIDSETTVKLAAIRAQGMVKSAIYERRTLLLNDMKNLKNFWKWRYCVLHDLLSAQGDQPRYAPLYYWHMTFCFQRYVKLCKMFEPYLESKGRKIDVNSTCEDFFDFDYIYSV